jgi:SEC-C motif domain protein
MQCPCHSGKMFAQCCEPIISGQNHAETAEQLMRARYTAYTQLAMDFIEKTHDPKTRNEFDMKGSREWAETTQWRGLEIVEVKQGGPDDEIGTVEFKAMFETDQGLQVHRELSLFRKQDGVWYFSDGKTPGAQPIVRSEPKVGRNDPCPCGSGRKFKKCCGTV